MDCPYCSAAPGPSDTFLLLEEGDLLSVKHMDETKDSPLAALLKEE
jgi:hypothetical protein